jgi:hypothetical protein
VTARVQAVPAEITARAPRVRGGRRPGLRRGGSRAQQKCFENTCDLAGDLLRAQNAGVTPCLSKNGVSPLLHSTVKMLHAFLFLSSL